jgi:hypothetical protein
LFFWICKYLPLYGGFLNGGTSKSSILIGCSVRNHLFWGIPPSYRNPFFLLVQHGGKKMSLNSTFMYQLLVDFGETFWFNNIFFLVGKFTKTNKDPLPPNLEGRPNSCCFLRFHDHSNPRVFLLKADWRAVWIPSNGPPFSATKARMNISPPEAACILFRLTLQSIHTKIRYSTELGFQN